MVRVHPVSARVVVSSAVVVVLAAAMAWIVLALASTPSAAAMTASASSTSSTGPFAVMLTPPYAGPGGGVTATVPSACLGGLVATVAGQRVEAVPDRLLGPPYSFTFDAPVDVGRHAMVVDCGVGPAGPDGGEAPWRAEGVVTVAEFRVRVDPSTVIAGDTVTFTGFPCAQVSVAGSIDAGPALVQASSFAIPFVVSAGAAAQSLEVQVACTDDPGLAVPVGFEVVERAPDTTPTGPGSPTTAAPQPTNPQATSPPLPPTTAPVATAPAPGGPTGAVTTVPGMPPTPTTTAAGSSTAGPGPTTTPTTTSPTAGRTPTATPTPTPRPTVIVEVDLGGVRRSPQIVDLVRADEVDWSPLGVLRSLALGAVLGLAFALPAGLFNRAVDDHRRRHPARDRRRPAPMPLAGRAAPVLLFGLVAGVVGAVVDPSAGFDRTTAVLVVGVAATTVASTVVGAAPARWRATFVHLLVDPPGTGGSAAPTDAWPSVVALVAGFATLSVALWLWCRRRGQHGDRGGPHDVEVSPPAMATSGRGS